MFLLLGSASLIVVLFGLIPVSVPKDSEVAGLQISAITNTLSIPPSPTPTITPTQTPTPEPNLAVTDIHVYPYKTTNDLLQQINSFRTSKGLAPLTTNSETCFFANLRSQEIISSFNHNGFRNRIDSNSLPYPSYSSVAENISMNSDPNQVVPGWINSPGHNENISKDVPFGCVVGNGDYYVFEAWKP